MLDQEETWGHWIQGSNSRVDVTAFEDHGPPGDRCVSPQHGGPGKESGISGLQPQPEDEFSETQRGKGTSSSSDAELGEESE